MSIDVSHVAKLANLKLSEEEENKFEKQLEEVLGYVEKLKEIDTSGTEETSQVTGLQNVTREDIAQGCEITQEEAISASKSTHNGLFKVKGILPNE